MLNLTVYYIIGKVYNTIGNPLLFHYWSRCFTTIGNPNYYIIGKYYNIIGKLLHYYYTSREDALILLDESHVSKLLATCVSVGSLTAVTIQRIRTRCQGAVS